jgi:hypothetical protein
LVKGHGDMTGTHRQGADHNCIALSYPTIGYHTAKQRREVNEAGVETENLRGQRLGGERTDNRFYGGTEAGKTADVLNMPWKQQLVDHVKDDERRHSVEREPFPCFGEGQVEKAPGMAYESGLVSAGAHLSTTTDHRVGDGNFVNVAPLQFGKELLAAP